MPENYVDRMWSERTLSKQQEVAPKKNPLIQQDQSNVQLNLI